MKTKVKNVMSSKLITLPTGSTLLQAKELMDEKRIRHIPIVNGHFEIVGIFSDRDLITSLPLTTTPVETTMSASVEFVHQELPLRSTILRMLEKHLSAVLICDEHQQAVGILTTEDLLWQLAHLLEKETERSTLMALLDIQTLNQAATQISNAGI